MTQSEEVNDRDGTDLITSLSNGAFRESIGLDTEDLPILQRVAERALTAGDHESAIRTYAILVLLDPMRTDYQLALAECALSVDSPDIALHAASAVIAFDPANARGYFASARACIAMGLLDEAREDLDDVCRLAREARDGELFAAAQALAEGLA